MLSDEAVDGGLQIDDRVEYAAFQAALGKLGEEALDGVEPRAGCWGEVEGEARMAVLLHVAPDHGSIENIEGRKQRCRAVALVVVGHRSEPPFLERQPRLCAIKRLNLAFLVERQHDGMRGWVDIKADNIAEFICELGIVRQFELAETVGLKAVRLPYPAHRAGADPDGSCHHVRRPVRRLARGIGQGQRHHPFSYLRREAGDARRPGLVSQQALNAFGHEALLPAPNTSLRLARLPHDPSRADAVCGQQDDRRAPNMLLGGVAILGQTLKAKTVRG